MAPLFLMARRGLLVAVLAAAGCAGRFFYYPDREVYRIPSDRKLSFEDVFFEAADGTRLHGWFIPAMGDAKGTVVHFHGNAQNMTAHFSFVHWLPAERFNLFVFDYRGYGRSEGRPTRRGLCLDGVAALRTVRARADADPDRIFVLGQSLGAAVAVAALDHAPDLSVRAVALESPFYSYRSIVRDKIGLAPAIAWLRWPLSLMVVGNSYSPSSAIRNLAPVPLLVLHGTDDVVIPFRHGKELYRRAGEPKTFSRIEGGGHTEAFTQFRDRYRPDLVAFFESALREPPASRPSD